MILAYTRNPVKHLNRRHCPQFQGYCGKPGLVLRYARMTSADPLVPTFHRGDRMRKAREEIAHIKQKEMVVLLEARGIECSDSTIGNWEHGAVPQRNKVELETLLRAWAEITNVSYEWLLLGEGHLRRHLSAVPLPPGRMVLFEGESVQKAGRDVVTLVTAP